MHNTETRYTALPKDYMDSLSDQWRYETSADDKLEPYISYQEESFHKVQQFFLLEHIVFSITKKYRNLPTCKYQLATGLFTIAQYRWEYLQVHEITNNLSLCISNCNNEEEFWVPLIYINHIKKPNVNSSELKDKVYVIDFEFDARSILVTPEQSFFPSVTWHNEFIEETDELLDRLTLVLEEADEIVKV